jgi:hypothetical protein
MKDIFQATKLTAVGAIILPAVVVVMVSLLPLVAIDYLRRKKRGRQE